MIGHQKPRGPTPALLAMGFCCFLSIINMHFLLSLNFDFDNPKTFQQVEPSESHLTTTIVNGKCQCNLLSSLDCLESIACVPRGADLQDSIAQGVFMRDRIRSMARMEDYGPFYPAEPIGKMIQYTTINAFDKWVNQNILNPHDQFSVFINETFYPDCVENNLYSKDCFFKAVHETDYHDSIETHAIEASTLSESKEAFMTKELETFRNKSRYSGNSLPAKSHLLVFAHLCRIYFNIRSPIIESYEKFQTTIPAEDIPDEKKSSEGEVLRVSLHLRRADSCEHEKEGKGERYLDKASELNSTAQVTGQRFCYNTAVYMNALLKVRELAGFPSLEVYVSTDYSGELMDEIREHFPDLYRSSTWKYMAFPRDTFEYTSVIEAHDNIEKRPFLGETAVDDLWHLSHGQVFIGHMGSRFGKIGWMLATAKYNTFIPYFTVDGRSYCCEIDENCAEATQHINSMEHCLTFAHDRVMIDVPEDQDLYWKVGSTVRKRYVEKVKSDRKRIDNFLGSSAV